MEDEDLDLDLDETEIESGYILNVDGPLGMNFIAKDNEGRRIETCCLDLEGDYEDLIASAQDLIDFLRKHGATHSFEASEA